jgi:hypothetical protein
MDSRGVISIILATVAVFAAIWGIGGLLQRASQKTIKYINWVVSAIAFASGLAAYATGEGVYFNIFLGSLVFYFLTIKYKTES